MQVSRDTLVKDLKIDYRIFMALNLHLDIRFDDMRAGDLHHVEPRDLIKYRGMGKKTLDKFKELKSNIIWD